MKRLTQWCYRHHLAVLITWIAMVVGLGGAVAVAGASFTDTAAIPNSESTTAYALLAQATGGQSAQTTAGTIVWHSDGYAITDPVIVDQVEPVLAKIRAQPGVAALVSPYSDDGGQQLNPQANTAFATIALTDAADADQISDLAKSLDSDHLSVQTGGQAFSVIPGISGGIEAIGVLAALAVLFVVFRSRWAAALPIITGVAGVGVSLLGVILASHVVNLSDTTITMAALIGLGVGIDYALFIVNRYRKALMDGADVPGAIGQAVNTSGRAVVFAGLTVMIALLGIQVVGLDLLTSMARAAALTVLVTVASALTLLPALLGILRHKVLSPTQRRQLNMTEQTASRTAPHDTEDAVRSKAPLAARWASAVGRTPVPFAIGGLLIIAMLALPATSLRVMDADASSDPVGSDTHSYYEMTSAAFGDGFDAQLLLVAKVPDAAASTAFDQLVATLPGVDDVANVAAYPLPAGTGIEAAVVIPSSSAQTEATEALVKHLRTDIIPSATAGTDLSVYVGGTTATAIDLADTLMGHLPLYLALIGILGFLLLAIAFRSILVPLVGALTNLATIAVGLGVLTAVFQWGWGSQLLGVGSGAPINYMLPVLVGGVLFGLSMDYQVFLISRVQEEWSITGDNRRAVRVGVAETGRVIVAAALIMFCVFASFGFSGERIVSSIGIALAAAVLVDALVMRMTVVPALMRLLGRANWWYPRWADRITPHVSIEATPDTTVDATRELAAPGASRHR